MVVIDTWENNYSLKSGEIVKMDKPGRDGVGEKKGRTNNQALKTAGDLPSKTKLLNNLSDLKIAGHSKKRDYRDYGPVDPTQGKSQQISLAAPFSGT